MLCHNVHFVPCIDQLRTADDDLVLSCSTEATPKDVDTCCVETFGGLVVSTQFWDTYTGLEAEGQLLPEDTWGLHGLWPDYCDGSYTQYCDLNRQYDPSPSKTTNYPNNGTVVPPYNGTGVDVFIEDFGRYDLLAWMNTYVVISHNAQRSTYFNIILSLQLLDQPRRPQRTLLGP